MRPRVLPLLALLLAAACGGNAAPPATPAAANASAAGAPHATRTETVDYTEGTTALEGFLAAPADAKAGDKLPAVLVVHDWLGISDNTKMRATEIAKLGYVAFAADIYGKGVRPGPAEAGAIAGKYKADRALLRARARAALARLAQDPRVDASKVVAIGYCFGGTTALELGRDGARLAGIVSFHGGLDTPKPDDAKNIKGKVLALHGADDPYVKPEEVAAFQDEMRKAKVDWQFVSYGGAVHAFTIKEAGNDNSKGAAYNAAADARSWSEFRRFLGELWPQHAASGT